MTKLILIFVVFIGVPFALYSVIKITNPDLQLSRFRPRHWVNLDERDDSPTGAASKIAIENPPFRVAIAPIVSPEKSLVMYQGFVEYIAKRLGKTPVPLYRQTYVETNDLVRYGQCDIALVSTYPFIRGEKEFGMQALVVPQVRGATTYQSFILIPQSSNATSLLDLRGKRFASADIASTTGWLFPAIWLMQQGEDPNRFFGEHIISGSHDRSIQAVADGFVDGAAVNGLVYYQIMTETPSMLKRTKIMLKSPSFAIPPVVVNPNIDPDLKKEALSVLLSMHNDVEGKRILDGLQIERFVVPEKGLFDSLRRQVARLEAWR
jgi:phosphonate transport system substrate-binding protein